MHIGARLRNYFLTGLLVVGPVTITLYAANWFVNFVDSSIKPFVPRIYNPDTYLPFSVPGIGLVFAIIGLMLIGALAANLLGRTLISYGDLFLGRMPIVRNVYRAVQQIFESVISAAGPTANFQKVGLIQFPATGNLAMATLRELSGPRTTSSDVTAAEESPSWLLNGPTDRLHHLESRPLAAIL